MVHIMRGIFDILIEMEKKNVLDYNQYAMIQI